MYGGQSGICRFDDSKVKYRRLHLCNTLQCDDQILSDVSSNIARNNCVINHVIHDTCKNSHHNTDDISPFLQLVSPFSLGGPRFALTRPVATEHCVGIAYIPLASTKKISQSTVSDETPIPPIARSLFSFRYRAITPIIRGIRDNGSEIASNVPNGIWLLKSIMGNKTLQMRAHKAADRINDNKPITKRPLWTGSSSVLRIATSSPLRISCNIRILHDMDTFELTDSPRMTVRTITHGWTSRAWIGTKGMLKSPKNGHSLRIVKGLLLKLTCPRAQ